MHIYIYITVNEKYSNIYICSRSALQRMTNREPSKFGAFELSKLTQTQVGDMAPCRLGSHRKFLVCRLSRGQV